MTARAATMTIVKKEIVLSIIINILARRVSGKTSVGLNAVTVYEQAFKHFHRTSALYLNAWAVFMNRCLSVSFPCVEGK